MRLTHRSTMLACYNGYITQAISINLAPLLYVTFQRDFSVELWQIGTLIACNFALQLAVDLLASLFADRMNLRFWTVFAHAITAAGLCGLTVLPRVLPPFTGLLIAEALLGLGGGFTEVMISPLLEACPTEGKSGNMSLLHSFYSWGQAGVILLSSLFFFAFGVENWSVLPVLWAIVPILGAAAFSIVPIYRLPTGGESGLLHSKKLFSEPQFWIFLLMMFCGGASEMVMSQWASGFAESALGMTKSVGDLFGPCLFALLMGVSRVLYGILNHRWKLEPLMMVCCVLCISSYLLAALSGSALLGLLGCALCGFSVGIFWPGILSRSAERMPEGGMSMFALLALAGDVGCLLGPSAAGWIADLFGGELRYAFLFAVLFPLVNLGILLMGRRRTAR